MSQKDVEAASASPDEPSEPGSPPAEEGSHPSAVSDSPDAVVESTPEVAATEEVPPEPPAKTGEPAEPVQESGDAAPGGESEEVRTLRQAMQDKAEIEGRVIGWNNGGFHVVVGATTAFCPRSEMELGAAKDPSEYLDKTLEFQVLRVQKKGRRVVLSRAALLRGERAKIRSEARDKLSAGSVVKGRVASLTDFGAFVDLGGVQGLVHVS
ncbi:MAG: S1 RNA-binding domain-containing protein, partial [Thermoanaerobaculia bacterium]